ncbi:thioesterase II family protein [Streptomyces sp. NPDC003480]
MGGRDPWVRELRRTERPAAHVVFLPHAGGAATYFAPFAHHFPGELDLSAVQYPGRQERLTEPLVPTVEGLAEELVPSLRKYAADEVPLVLFGHSMGASVAFEAAVRLAAEGAAAPRRLVVSGSPAPSARRKGRVRGCSDQEILEDLAELGGTEGEIIDSPDLMDLLMPALRSDYRAAALYRPAVHSVVDAPLLCLTGDQDPYVTHEQAAAWRAHTSGDFRMGTLPGGHFFLNEHREAVARLVADHIGRTHGDRGPDGGA